ncbi:hypothetical protein [Paraburkholderia acidiphila]|uniref:Uncharacterized protein n=1 Tax=Paraburkholderia acidiphila TaxID=2571747 RepID=A0A7Z2J943_9BURK|nr:hypothetical protein [Paraburkholderia acidiphila]QGZ55089.1 hypothetical protein FAZ97_09255 [Paraburkholderia acidiphila]
MEINIFKDLAKAVSAFGDAIGRIGDGVKHLVVLGAEGYDAARRRRIDRRLRNMSADVSAIAGALRTMAQHIREYVTLLNRPSPDNVRPAKVGEFERRWKLLRTEARRLERSTETIRRRLAQERSDFFLRQDCDELKKSLAKPGDAIAPIVASLYPPFSTDVLDETATGIERLAEELEGRRFGLNLYIEGHTP